MKEALNQGILSHKTEHFIFTTIFKGPSGRQIKTFQTMSHSKRKLTTLLFERTEDKKIISVLGTNIRRRDRAYYLCVK